MIRTRLYLKESKEKDRQWESKIAFRFIRENALFRKHDDIYKQCMYLLRFCEVDNFLLFLYTCNKDDLIQFCNLLDKYVNSVFFTILKEDILDFIKRE